MGQQRSQKILRRRLAQNHRVMKRKATTTGNPSAVLRAFAPDTPYVLTLDGYLLLEALGSPLATGAKPGMYDMTLAALVMTEEAAVYAARRAGKLDELVRSATAGKRPADIMAITPAIIAAIAAAFDPVNTSASIPSEKKSSPAPAGG